MLQAGVLWQRAGSESIENSSGNGAQDATPRGSIFLNSVGRAGDRSGAITATFTPSDASSSKNWEEPFFETFETIRRLRGTWISAVGTGDAEADRNVSILPPVRLSTNRSDELGSLRLVAQSVLSMREASSDLETVSERMLPSSWARRTATSDEEPKATATGAISRQASPRHYTAEDVRLALRSASPIVRCIVHSEIGMEVVRNGVRYEAFDPNVPGALGERGPAQLLVVGGLYQEFHRWVGEGANELSPFQSLPYIQWVVDAGRGSNWSGYRNCRSLVSRGLYATID